MKNRTIWFVSLLLLFKIRGTNAPGASIPDTGQTTCYDGDGHVITCSSPGQNFYGQDANYTINPPSYTKLDKNGKALPDSATSWVMVLDNVTGLIWEVKQDKDGVQNYNNRHDADNTYNWYDPNPTTNGGNAGMPGNGTDTYDFINALKNAHFGGYSDWRMPGKEELRSICDYERSDPSIRTDYFPDTVSSSYCSSTTYAIDASCVWGVNFDLASTGKALKDGHFNIRAVRGGHLASQFKNNGNGTVTDMSTLLMWQQDTARDRHGNYRSMTWQEALEYCEALVLQRGRLYRLASPHSKGTWLIGCPQPFLSRHR